MVSKFNDQHPISNFEFQVSIILSEQMQEDEFKIKISIIHKIMLYATLLVFISVGISTYLAVKTESKEELL